MENLKYVNGCVAHLTEEQYNNLMKLAVSFGVELWRDDHIWDGRKIPVLYSRKLGVTPLLAQWTTISAGEFISEVSKLFKVEEPIMAGEYKAEFKNDGVQFGCTFVSKDVVEKVYKKLFNK